MFNKHATLIIAFILLLNILNVCSMSAIFDDVSRYNEGINTSPFTQVTFHSIIGDNGENSYLFTEPWIETDSGKLDWSDGDITENCMRKLKRFSNATSLFINCAVTNARPMHYCEKCVDEYISVNNTYKVIFDDENTNHGCREQILRADNIQLVLLTHNFVQYIWQKSTCDNCFNVTTVNKTKIYHPTDDVKQILHSINVTLKCFKNSRNGSHNSTVCNVCQTFYEKTNNLYEKMEKEGKLCSDLIDSMNYTRLDWSDEYNCTNYAPDKGEIWGMSAIVILLPVILYLGAYLYVNRSLKCILVCK